MSKRRGCLGMVPRWSPVRESIVRDAADKHSESTVIPGTWQHKTMVRLPSHSSHVVTEFR